MASVTATASSYSIGAGNASAAGNDIDRACGLVPSLGNAELDGIGDGNGTLPQCRRWERLGSWQRYPPCGLVRSFGNAEPNGRSPPIAAPVLAMRRQLATISTVRSRSISRRWRRPSELVPSFRNAELEGSGNGDCALLQRRRWKPRHNWLGCQLPYLF